MTAAKSPRRRSPSPASDRSFAWLQPVLDAAKGLPHPFFFVIILLVLLLIAGLTWNRLVQTPNPFDYLFGGLFALVVSGAFFMAWRSLFQRQAPAPKPPEVILPTDHEDPNRLSSDSKPTPEVPHEPSVTLDREQLREIYMRKLWDECYTVKTTTFKAATAQEALELELSEIFTDLNVRKVERDPAGELKGADRREPPAHGVDGLAAPTGRSGGLA